MSRPRLLFGELFFGLRQAGVKVGLNEWMALLRALGEGMVGPSLRDFYAVSRALLVKDESHFDTYDQVFEAVFGEGAMPEGIREELLQWLENPIAPPELTPEQLAELEALPLDRLRELLEERLREQDGRHDGGSKWIGTGGTSPFGYGGRNPAGIRIGGPGGGRSAVQIAHERRFRDYRKDRVLDTRAITVALKKLRRLSRHEGRPELDVEESIEATCKNAGELELVFRPPRRNDARVLLMMDVGGSMDPHARVAERLFSAAHRLDHWREFEAFFFHNCPYSRVWSSYLTGERTPTLELIRDRPKDTFLIVVGDAYMAPSELVARYGSIDMGAGGAVPGIEWLYRLRKHFERCVWLNPLPLGYARGSYTIRLVQQLFPMFPLTVEGLEEAVDHLLRKKPAPVPELDVESLTRGVSIFDLFE